VTVSVNRMAQKEGSHLMRFNYEVAVDFNRSGRNN